MSRARDYFMFSAIVLLLGGKLLTTVRHSEGELEKERSYFRSGCQACATGNSESVKQEHVLQLPEDGENWYLTLFYRDRQHDRASIRLAEMFNNNTRLNRLMQQVHFNKFQPGDRLYQLRYAAVFGGPEMLPAVVLQQPDGHVCYKASGSNILASADGLADEIALAIADCRPKPRPEPTPSPGPVPAPDIVPDLRPRRTTNDATTESTLLTVLIPLLAGGLGIYQEWKKAIGG